MESNIPRRRCIYNPYLLKLLHSKAFYVDKLLSLYLLTVSQVKHDVMRWFLVYNYHTRLILDDVLLLTTRVKTEQFPLDVYLVNFEFTLFRLCEQYVKAGPLERDTDTNDGLYRSELILKSAVETNGKTALMRCLCERYTRRVYFSQEKTSYLPRVRERTSIFFNLKQTLEKRFISGITLNDDTIFYDKTAVSYLLLLFFLDEFIGDLTRRLHKVALSSIEGAYAYIRGETIELLVDDFATEKNTDLAFLRDVFNKLSDDLDDYVHGWCIKERPTVANKNSTRVETTKETEVRLHHEKYNRCYQDAEVPSLTTYPLDDPTYRRFILGGHEGDVLNTKPIFVPLLQGKKVHSAYESILHEMFFHVRLQARHTCTGDACNTCHYTYLHYPVSEFTRRCQQLRYNKEHYWDGGGDRLVFDRYLRHTIIEVVPVFKGLIYRVLYYIMLMMHHTDLVSEEAEIRNSPDMNLCAMIDVGELVASLFDNKTYFGDIETRLQRIVYESRHLVTVIPEEAEPPLMMSEKEEVRRLALDMAVLVDLIHGVDKQYLRIEKYERSLAKKPCLPGDYKIHTNMMRYLRTVYIYYMRTMHVIAT